MNGLNWMTVSEFVSIFSARKNPGEIEEEEDVERNRLMMFIEELGGNWDQHTARAKRDELVSLRIPLNICKCRIQLAWHYWNFYVMWCKKGYLANDRW